MLLRTEVYAEALKKEEITKSFETAFGKITEEGREGNSVSGTMLR